jgi:hypothetical protein
MGVVAQVLAVVEGLALIVTGIIGVFFYRHRRLYRFLFIEPENHEVVRPWTIYTGWANVLWGLGVVVGVVAVNLGFVEVGRTLVAFTTIVLIVLAFVILFTDLRFWKNVIALLALPVLVLLTMMF